MPEDQQDICLHLTTRIMQCAVLSLVYHKTKATAADAFNMNTAYTSKDSIQPVDRCCYQLSKAFPLNPTLSSPPITTSSVIHTHPSARAHLLLYMLTIPPSKDPTTAARPFSATRSSSSAYKHSCLVSTTTCLCQIRIESQRATTVRPSSAQVVQAQ
jgi:hypothetical protein